MYCCCIYTIIVFVHVRRRSFPKEEKTNLEPFSKAIERESKRRRVCRRALYA